MFSSENSLSSSESNETAQENLKGNYNVISLKLRVILKEEFKKVLINYQKLSRTTIYIHIFRILIPIIWIM